jgi:alkylation response protein AidB-like acyl-CoA dehydrogenase
MAHRFPEDRAELRATLLAKVESVREVVEACADEAEELRTLPRKAVDAIAETGLFMMKAPREVGGGEADPVTQIVVIEAMARMDTSAGWTTMIGAGAASMATAFLSDGAIREIFGQGRPPRFAASARPMGMAVPCEGGYMVNGRWPYASGVLHADWITAGVNVANADNPTGRRVLVVPTSSVTIHDNWHVAGLKGTGSCDFSLEDLFVPQEFTCDVFNDQLVRGGPLYRIRVPGALTSEHSGFALGAGRRALDEIADLAQAKARGIPPSRLIDRGVFQHFVGEADLRLKAARSLVIEAHERAWHTACAGEPVSVEMHVEMRGSAAYATQVALDIASQGFQYAGASALYSNSVIQRCFRDLAAAAQHQMVSTSAYESHGRVRLGFEGVNPML